MDVETSYIIKNINVETSYVEVADDDMNCKIFNYQFTTILCFQTENWRSKRKTYESQTWDQAESMDYLVTIVTNA